MLIAYYIIKSHQPKGVIEMNAQISNWSNQQPDTQPGHYYVTAHDAGKTYPMAGPFVNDHAGALAAVHRIREAACNIDGRACFMAWGTVRTPDTYTKPGRLNAVLGMEVAA